MNQAGAARIVVAGAGLIGRAHVAAVQAAPGVALAAVVDPAPASAELAARAGVPHYTSLADLFRRERPDGVVLATPNALHVPQALECLAVRVPVVVEKPVATSVGEGESLEFFGLPTTTAEELREVARP